MRLNLDEIRFITVILLILLVGTLVKHYRGKHPAPSGLATPIPAAIEPAGY